MAWLSRDAKVRWLSKRQVLLTPHAFGLVDWHANSLPIKLTRKQIEDSPLIDTHRPVSRQYEQDYYRYYGWPAYWEGGGMWGLAGFPVANPLVVQDDRSHHGHDQRDDLHLRSTRAVEGYEVHASDGTIGSARSFMVDDKSWAIGELVVESRHWFAGNEILIPSAKIKSVSYVESTILVDLTIAEIQRTTENGVVKIGG